MGKYIYGIINSNTIKSFVPFRTVRAVREPPLLTGFGLHKLCETGLATPMQMSKDVCATEEIYTIPYLDISAVVSNSKIVNYTHMIREELAKLLVGHQKVIERIMELGQEIIPMRLGTFAGDEDEVVDILGRGYSLIKEILDKIVDKIEIDVTATWSDFDSILKEIGDEKEIKEFKDKLLSNPKGFTVDDKIKIGELVKKGLDKKREKYASQIQNTLKTISQDFRAHELMDDKMVINMAFLLNKSGQKELDTKVKELNTKFNDLLNFRCIGPLPPYSFWTLEIKKMEFEEVDWARKRLGLNEFISKDEVKKAYKRAAASTHPDANPNIPGIEREFDDVIKAYKIAVDYCLAMEQAGQNVGQGFSLASEKFKNNAILVKLRV